MFTYSWTSLWRTSLRRILHYDEVKVRSRIKSFLCLLKSVVYIEVSLSNFLSVKVYCAVLRWRFLHKIKGLSGTAVFQFTHLSTQTVVVEHCDDCVTIKWSFTPISRSTRVICNRYLWYLVTALRHIEPTDTNSHAIIWVIDLLSSAYSIKLKSFKPSSLVRLQVNWLSVVRLYRTISIFQIVITLLS